jgi:hypothetical protein
LLKSSAQEIKKGGLGLRGNWFVINGSDPTKKKKRNFFPRKNLAEKY